MATRSTGDSRVIPGLAALLVLTLGLVDDDHHVHANDNSFGVLIDHTDLGTVTTDGGDADPIRNSNLDAICVATAISIGQEPFSFCDVPPDDHPQITPGMVAAAF